MTGYAGNGKNIYSGYNPLCDKLRVKFADSMHRAGNTGAQRQVNIPAKQTPSAGKANSKYRDIPDSQRRQDTAPQYNGQSRVQKNTSGAERRNFVQQNDRNDLYKRAPNQRSMQRSMAGGKNAVKAPTTARKKKQGFVLSAANHVVEKIRSGNVEAKRQKAAEIKLRKTPFPKGVLLLAIICTVMLLVVLFSYSQVYEMSGTISELKSQSAALTDEADKLQVEVELKDDIRTIEKIATEEIGMVKSDRVDTRYISISGGERIDVIESPDTESGNVNFFTTLLSAIGENFEKIRDRIE